MAKVAVKKTLTPKAAIHKVEHSTAGGLSDLRGYARKIWLAGLGAYAKVGAEGVDYFKELVKTGEGIEKQGKRRISEEVDAANEQLDEVKGSVKGNVTLLKGKVEVQLDRVETAFDNRVASALSRLGIASKQDVEALSAKLDQLSVALDSIARKP